jgi:ribokinase
MKGKIVVVGSLNMDLVVRSPRHPQPGETILGGEFQTFPGGKGANQAVAAARLGGNVWMVGKVGKDANGSRLVTGLEDEGVQTDFVFVDDAVSTGVALITVDEAGQNTIVVSAGANARLSAEDVERAEGAFSGAVVVLLQLEIPLPAVRQAVEMAHQHGAVVVLNPAPAQPLETDLYARCDYVIPNDNELKLLTGSGSGKPVIAMAEALQNMGARSVVVTLGSEGVLILEDACRKSLPSHNVAVVDTTAAGDAFLGAFAVALTRGHSVYDAAAWGNAAGALAVTHSGAQPSLPTLA